jgi:predicted ATP-dependent serine protease
LRSTRPAEPSVLLLYGEPGAGKSTLALQFAWEAQKDFDVVMFLTCGRRPLDDITAELVERLPIDVKPLSWLEPFTSHLFN